MSLESQEKSRHWSEIGQSAWGVVERNGVLDAGGFQPVLTNGVCVHDFPSGPWGPARYRRGG